jgi:hypothetical protein
VADAGTPTPGCFPDSVEHRIALGDRGTVVVRPPSGESVVAETAFVDPVSDIAVLMESDSNTRPEDWQEFDVFDGGTQSAPSLKPDQLADRHADRARKPIGTGRGLSVTDIVSVAEIG